MLEASFPARPVRTQYRHELRTLTYLTLDDGNGGVVRNLSHDGATLQVVSRLQPEQRVRLRFQLKDPRLRVEASGRVTWADSSGACGIHFLNLSAGSRNQIDEWILSDLLRSPASATNTPSIFEPFPAPLDPGEDSQNEADGLILSATARPPIQLQPTPPAPHESLSARSHNRDSSPEVSPSQVSHRAHPARTLAWAVDSLAILAALLLFAVIFLSIAHEVPQWQLSLILFLLATPFFAGAYWTLFALFGGPSLGVRVAQSGVFVQTERDSKNQ